MINSHIDRTLPDGRLEVVTTDSNKVDRRGRLINHRHVISPGDDVSNELADVKDEATLTHTPVVVTTFRHNRLIQVEEGIAKEASAAAAALAKDPTDKEAAAIAAKADTLVSEIATRIATAKADMDAAIVAEG